MTTSIPITLTHTVNVHGTEVVGTTLSLVGLPTRECWVPGYGLFEVPRHVVRIDSEDRRGPGYTGTHGWQVRHTDKSTFFSDSRFVNGKGTGMGPQASLLAAVNHLALTWAGPKPTRLRAEDPQKAIPTGCPGVRVVWRRHKGRTHSECIVRIDALDGSPLTTFYVGVQTTVTQERLQSVVARARLCRQAYLAQQNVIPPELGTFDVARAIAPVHA